MYEHKLGTNLIIIMGFIFLIAGIFPLANLYLFHTSIQFSIDYLIAYILGMTVSGAGLIIAGFNEKKEYIEYIRIKN